MHYKQLTGINVVTAQRIQSDTARDRLHGALQLAARVKALQLLDGVIQMVPLQLVSILKRQQHAP